MRKLWVPLGHQDPPYSPSSPLSYGAAATLARGDLLPLGPGSWVEEHCQGLAIAQILHICLQEMSSAPGSLPQGGCITQEQHQA